jgi:hypothetical protein
MLRKAQSRGAEFNFLNKPIHGAGVVGRKQVFGSDGSAYAWGCQTFALWVGLFFSFFLFNQPINCHQSVFF